jgi:hypothetical protein
MESLQRRILVTQHDALWRHFIGEIMELLLG